MAYTFVTILAKALPAILVILNFLTNNVGSVCSGSGHQFLLRSDIF